MHPRLDCAGRGSRTATDEQAVVVDATTTASQYRAAEIDNAHRTDKRAD
jgi:hypothetical protein